MMSSTAAPAFQHASFRGKFGVAQCDVTPPIGIHSRTWGAAEHDVAESIHRPLFLTAIAISSPERELPLVLICADLSYWKTPGEAPRLQARILEGLGLPPENVIFAISHTHAAPPLMVPDEPVPGGELLVEWMNSLSVHAVNTVRAALNSQFDGVLEWASGRCGLATVRDFADPTPGQRRYICGYAPTEVADDTLLVGRVTDSNGTVRATIVNYACHPTTLAWENKAISPDYIGAMRETIERVTHAPVFFLLGACGELAPRFQYTGDTTVADAHGRQLGHAVLSTLVGMEPPGMKLTFAGVMESGAPLAVWKRFPASSSPRLEASQFEVEIPIKRDWPQMEELEQAIAQTQDRFLQERLRRKRGIRLALGDGETYRLPVSLWRIGDAVLIGSSGEAYSVYQTQLRSQFPETTVICMNVINGTLGYLPPAGHYDQDIYPVWQTPFDRGCLEAMIEKSVQNIRNILS